MSVNISVHVNIPDIMADMHHEDAICRNRSERFCLPLSSARFDFLA